MVRHGLLRKPDQEQEPEGAPRGEAGARSGPRGPPGPGRPADLDAPATWAARPPERPGRAALPARPANALLLGRRLLVAVDDRLEVRAGPELGHRRLRHLDGRAGGRVASRAGRPDGFLEYPESGYGDFVALRDC